jgi:hypothetical protein
MGLFSTAMLIASLEGLKWLFWATAALLALLIVVQMARGDADARPLVNMVMGLAFVVAGIAANYAAVKVEAWARKR